MSGASDCSSVSNWFVTDDTLAQARSAALSCHRMMSSQHVLLSAEGPHGNVSQDQAADHLLTRQQQRILDQPGNQFDAGGTRSLPHESAHVDAADHDPLRRGLHTPLLVTSRPNW